MSPTDVFISNNTRSGQSGKPLVSVRPRCRRQRQRGERRLETHNDDENLFIRLSPKLIQTLQSDLEATAAASFSDPIRTQEHHSCWNYLIHGDGDFLPLQISFLDKDGTKTERETLYTSFNGGRLEDEEEGKNFFRFQVLHMFVCCICCLRLHSFLGADERTSF